MAEFRERPRKPYRGGVPQPARLPLTTPQRFAAASDLLWDHWQQGRRLLELPEHLRPASRAEGYAIQAQLERRSGHPIFGWKIAATSAAGQAHINVDGPLAGRVLRERVFEAGAELPFGANHMRVAEAEFAFRMGRELAPREQPYRVGEVLAAVATLHPAIEVPDSRYQDFTIVGAPQLIADNACAHLFVIGAPAPDAWRTIDLVEHAVTGTVRSVDAGRPSDVGRPFTGRRETQTCTGTGANVLGDPRVALAWLANELSGLGIPLREGQVVTTGTCIVPLPIEPGVEMIADFGLLGTVSAVIAD